MGRGTIAGLYGPFGSVYHRSHNSVARRFLRDAMERLFPSPLVRVDAQPCIDISLRRKGDALLIHLANTANMQTTSDYSVIDYIPPGGPIMIEADLNKEPQGIFLEPGHSPLLSEWSDGELRVVVNSLDIHSVVNIRE